MLKVPSNYEESIEFMKHPRKQEVYIELWGGNIIIESVKFKDLLNNSYSDDDIMFRTIIEPKMTIDDIKKHPAIIYEFLKTITLLKNGIFPKSKTYADTILNEEPLIFQMFYLAKTLSKNVWSDSAYIDDYNALEILYWSVFNDKIRSKS